MSVERNTSETIPVGTSRLTRGIARPRRNPDDALFAWSSSSC